MSLGPLPDPRVSWWLCLFWLAIALIQRKGNATQIRVSPSCRLGYALGPDPLLSSLRTALAAGPGIRLDHHGRRASSRF